MKFLHAADLHIDSPLRGLDRLDGAPVEAIRRAPRDAFRALIQLALDESVDFVLLAGDIYDGDWRDTSTGLFFASQLSRLGDMPVFIIQGNHDAQSVITTKLRPPKNVRVFDTRRPQTHFLDQLNVAIHGQSYATRALTADIAAVYPPKHPDRVNIGMLHTSLGGGYAGHDNYAPTALSTLIAKGYDYWALGHIHEHQTLSTDPLIVFSGNLQGRHMGETGPKGCVVVSDDTKTGVFRADFRPLDVVRWLKIRLAVENDADPDAIVYRIDKEIAAASVTAQGRTLCVRVELYGTSPCHADLIARHAELEAQLRSDMCSYDAWIERLSIETTSTHDLNQLRARDDLVGELFRTIDAVRRDGDRQTSLMTALTALRDKTPADIVRLFGTPLSPGPSFNAIIDDAERLLAARIIE